jgi:hypothetical protein
MQQLALQLLLQLWPLMLTLTLARPMRMQYPIVQLLQRQGVALLLLCRCQLLLCRCQLHQGTG